jgi:hypothetical protein
MYSSVANTQPVSLGDVLNPREFSVLQGIQREEERTLQVFAATQADYPQVFDRQTRISRFGVQVQKLHDTLASSLLYVGQHPGLVPAVGNARFEQDGASVWLIGCGIDRISLVQRVGVTTVFSYSFVGGYWSSQPPASGGTGGGTPSN